MATALIGLGSNVGDRQATLAWALDLIDSHPDIQVRACSRLHATEPIGGPAGQGEFLNAALRLETSLSPVALHDVLRDVERQLGRTRTVRWDQRTIDLDLLLYDAIVFETPELTVPHPSMSFRRFVLEPSAAVAPNMLHPVIGWTVAKLLQHLNSAVPYAAIAGFSFQRKSELARMLAERFDRELITDPCAEDLQLALADPTSFTEERQLEFLDRRAQAIDASRWLNWSRWTISDFWINEDSAYLQYPSTAGPVTETSALEFARFIRRRSDALARAMPPKLVIVLDPDRDFGSIDATELWTLLRPDRERPTVFLRTSDPQRQFAEASAALEAMS